MDTQISYKSRVIKPSLHYKHAIYDPDSYFVFL